MKITKDQIIAIQSALSKDFPDRDNRLEHLSNFFGYPIKSTKDLTKFQAIELLHFINTGEVKSKRSWGFFKKGNKQHSKILNILHDLNWLTQYEGKTIPDLERLGGWLQSYRAPIQKPLMQQNPTELTKTINALTGILKKKYVNN